MWSLGIGSLLKCSTPEGIGGGIRGGTRRRRIQEFVLNARRHRRGNQSRVELHRPVNARVLNARRHRRGNQARL